MVAEDLFESALEERFDEFAPLAARMRPKTLDEFVGQDHIVGKGGPLRSLIEADRLTSVILWGPPGTGKTTLASIVATATKSRFVQLSAVSSGVADVRKVLKESRESLGATGRKTILFIDEIHRFNKSQQDALLQAVENSWVTLIGATTENPFFEVNSPLISRSLLFRLNPLGAEEIRTIVDRAIKEPKRGLGASGISVEPDAVAHIVDRAGGDARFALNALEVSVAVATARGDDTVKTATAEEALQRRVVRYGKGGDQHYDVISAFIKSMRGSDPDAAVWWLAQMLEAGEDPRFIARRMVIFASEDVGNADPMALVVAVSAFHALEFVGLPEAQLNLSQAVLYLATAPKSNASTTAIAKASRTLQERGVGEVPKHLRDAHYPGAKKLGHGEGYRYPHSFEGGWVEQQYLPDNVSEETFYLPTDRGYEKEISELMKSRQPPASGNAKKTRKPRP
ncbi:MAG: replication-associated recombination protein A [Actinobacteria bacterium]|nr:replication-associated recombination protein A [Actinomycetota bacterium]